MARSLDIFPKWYVTLHRQNDCEDKVYLLAGHDMIPLTLRQMSAYICIGMKTFTCNYPSAIVSGTKALLRGLKSEVHFPMVRRWSENFFSEHLPKPSSRKLA